MRNTHGICQLMPRELFLGFSPSLLFCFDLPNMVLQGIDIGPRRPTNTRSKSYAQKPTAMKIECKLQQLSQQSFYYGVIAMLYINSPGHVRKKSPGPVRRGDRRHAVIVGQNQGLTPPALHEFVRPGGLLQEAPHWFSWDPPVVIRWEISVVAFFLFWGLG